VPLVTARPIGQSNGDIVTEFTDVADTGVTTWTYPTKQNSLTFDNDGEQLITVTVNGTGYAVNPGQSRTINAAFTSFTTQSASKTQEFDARATNTTARDLARKAYADANGLTGNASSYTYLPDGSVETVTEKDANGSVQAVTTFTYNAVGNVGASVKVMNGQTITTQYIYDANGNLTDTVSTLT
jgi:YD repeat-containing protein